MKHGVIAGPYVPIYAEVTRKLAGVKSMSARWVYIVLVTLFKADEEWGDDPVWVSGIIRANKVDIARESGVNYKGFYQLWKQLVDAGLVHDREDGLIVVKFYKKKAYDSISALEVRERFAKLEAILENSPETPDQEEDDHPDEPDDHPDEPDDHPEFPDDQSDAHPFKGFKKQIEEEEEEATSASRTGSQEREPGSRDWIAERIDNLWPGRGFKPESDADYLAELEKFSVPELEAAFERARTDKAKYGNYSYLLNYLRNPSLYEKKRRGEGKRGKKRGQPERDDDIGKLEADWLDDE
jgi:hypothetical protein